MINRKDLSNFGIGTWGIGGFAERNPDNDDGKQIDALVYMLNHGINFIELNLWTAEGHCAYLVAEAIRKSKVSRNDLFLTQTIYSHSANTIKDAEKEVISFKELFETDYIDVMQFGGKNFNLYGYDESIQFLEKYLSNNTARYVGVMNSELDFIKKFHKHFVDELFSFEVGFNFEIRESEELGLIDYTKKNGILNVIYQPLRRNRTANHNYPLLVELSKKYNKTQNQILLNWIVSKELFPITKSETIKHIDEHLAAFNFTIDAEDVDKLNSWRHPKWKTPKIDWDHSGEGVTIDQLSNVFDEEISKD